MTTETIQPGDLVQIKISVPYDTDYITGCIHHCYLDFDVLYLFLGCSVATEGHPAYKTGVLHVQLLDREGNVLYVLLEPWDNQFGYLSGRYNIDELFTKVRIP